MFPNISSLHSDDRNRTSGTAAQAVQSYEADLVVMDAFDEVSEVGLQLEAIHFHPLYEAKEKAI